MLKPSISAITGKNHLWHDPSKPILVWFQDTPIGKELFFALYTKKCEWARCSFCALPTVSSPYYIGSKNIFNQVKYICNSLSVEQINQIKRVFISNNGSIFNYSTITPKTIGVICEYLIKLCPNLEYICFETRLDTINQTKLLHYVNLFAKLSSKYYKKQLRNSELPVKVQVSTGYETKDPFLRNRILCKGYPEWMLHKFYKSCNSIYQKTGFQIYSDENVLLKPAVGITDHDAIKECAETIRHLYLLGKRYNVEVSVRINPTFVANGTALHQGFIEKKFTPPKLTDVIEVLQLYKDFNICMPVFIGLNEENLSVENGSFPKKSKNDIRLVKLFQLFNKDQNISLLEEVFTEEKSLGH